MVNQGKAKHGKIHQLNIAYCKGFGIGQQRFSEVGIVWNAGYSQYAESLLAVCLRKSKYIIHCISSIKSVLPSTDGPNTRNKHNQSAGKSNAVRAASLELSWRASGRLARTSHHTKWTLEQQGATWKLWLHRLPASWAHPRSCLRPPSSTPHHSLCLVSAAANACRRLRDCVSVCWIFPNILPNNIFH